MPPALFAPIVENLAKADLLERARVAIEKPFGHDLESARDLNARLRAVLDEDQILRVDHFLGKQPVEELQYLRFANNGLAKLWDRESISEIHITMAEDFGIEDRGKFYDAVGALRDVVQNHLLQVLALVAMEPPVGAGDDDLNDKKAEVFRAMPALDPERCVRGQYRGYTEVAGVAKDSTTETYVALRTEIDNWRWAGVPIFLRAGKALPEKVTEVRMFLHHVPGFSFLPNRRPPDPNQIVLRIDPDPGCGCSCPLRSAIRGTTFTWTRRSPRISASRYAPTNGCSTPRSTEIASCSPARTPSKRRGGSCSRCWTSRVESTTTTKAPGGRRPPKRWCVATTPGRSRGCRAARPRNSKETRDSMQLGMIGLGRMGANIVRRVVAGGHECVVYDHNPDAVEAMAGRTRPPGCPRCKSSPRR